MFQILTLTCYIIYPYLSRMFLMFVDIPIFPRIDLSVNTFRSWAYDKNHSGNPDFLYTCHPTVFFPQGLPWISTEDSYWWHILKDCSVCFQICRIWNICYPYVCVANGHIHIVNVRYYPCMFHCFVIILYLWWVTIFLFIAVWAKWMIIDSP